MDHAAPAAQPRTQGSHHRQLYEMTASNSSWPQLSPSFTASTRGSTKRQGEHEYHKSEQIRQHSAENKQHSQTDRLHTRTAKPILDLDHRHRGGGTSSSGPDRYAAFSFMPTRKPAEKRPRMPSTHRPKTNGRDARHREDETTPAETIRAYSFSKGFLSPYGVCSDGQERRGVSTAGIRLVKLQTKQTVLRRPHALGE